MHLPLDTRLHRTLRPSSPDQGATATPAIGELIDGRYRIRRMIGEGASGRVFLADDIARQDTPVAIKVAKLVVGRDLLRLEQEARLAFRIVHPNVCRVLGFGRLADARPYLVTEALRGRPLSIRLEQEKTLGWKATLSIVSQLLYGLHAVHQLRIVHRDVKPGNVFLASAGGGGPPRVKLLDFGFAKAPPEMALVVTRTGYTFGTPGYIAPELLAGKPADARSDLFSVGVVLFQMLAGSMPFRPVRGERNNFPLLRERPRSLEDWAKGLPPRLYRIVGTALEKDPGKRFQTASAFLAALERVCMEPERRGAWPPIIDDSWTSGGSSDGSSDSQTLNTEKIIDSTAIGETPSSDRRIL